MAIDPELKLAIREARIGSDSAVVAAEQLAGHGIVESGTFDRMVGFLLDVQAALDRAHSILEQDHEIGEIDGVITHARLPSGAGR
jgi:hypothetical protein